MNCAFPLFFTFIKLNRKNIYKLIYRRSDPLEFCLFFTPSTIKNSTFMFISKHSTLTKQIFPQYERCLQEKTQKVIKNQVIRESKQMSAG